MWGFSSGRGSDFMGYQEQVLAVSVLASGSVAYSVPFAFWV